MIARRYKSDDKWELFEWSGAHGLDTFMLDNLPSIGFFVRGIAVGFLRQCEGDLCILEGLMTNPKASSEKRNEAIDLIVKALIDAAGLLKMKSMIAYSVDESTLERSQKHGFRKQPHTLITLNLGDTYGFSQFTIRN